MTQQQYIINRKMNILELGETLGNISLACRRLGVSRHNGHPGSPGSIRTYQRRWGGWS